VARARTAGDHADAGLAGQLAVRLGHVRRATLVAGVHEPEPVSRVVERVEQREVALPGDAERHLRAVEEELIDQDLAAGTLGHVTGRRD